MTETATRNNDRNSNDSNNQQMQLQQPPSVTAQPHNQ